MPRYLTQPLPAPERIEHIRTNQDLIVLLTDYEQLRRRMNTDRDTVQKLWEGMKVTMVSELETGKKR